VLIARIYEVFPLLYSNWTGQMGQIAFITHNVDIRQISIKSGLTRSPSTSPRHTGRRFGTAVMRRWMTQSNASQIGI
jgi:hypothetical protein